jgi:hypothetical protein
LRYNIDSLASLSLNPDSDISIIPLPECRNSENDDPAEDTYIDYPDDPGCTGEDDASESPNPPPPPTEFVFNGADYSNCDSEVVCYTSGASVFSCWEYHADYDMDDQANVTDDFYNLIIRYSNGSDGHCSGPHAPKNYSYHVRILVNGSLRKTVNLPAPSGKSIATRTIYIGRLNENSVIRFDWDNDSNPSAAEFDANFKIDKITLNREGDVPSDDPACQQHENCQP